MFVINLLWAFPSDTTREELDHMILAKAPQIWKAFEEARAMHEPINPNLEQMFNAPTKVQ